MIYLRNLSILSAALLFFSKSYGLGRAGGMRKRSTTTNYVMNTLLSTRVAK